MSRGAKRRVAPAAVLMLALAIMPAGASASFSGQNARFALSWDHDPGTGVSNDDLATLKKTGDDFRVLEACDFGCHLTQPDWSPDGRRLVYAGDWDEFQHLDVERPDGSGFRVVDRFNGGFYASPAWSPRGRRIAFALYRQSGAGSWISDLYVINRDGTDRKRITDTPHRSERDVDWSAENRLVFTRACDLFRMRPNGLGLRRLTATEACEGAPDWAPGGKRLTYVRGGDIWRVGAWGQNASLLAAGGSSPTWAPDGTRIAFVSTVDGAIHTVEPDGTDETVIGNPVSDGRIWGLDWQAR
jgi:Tol biopolymer transport system component